MADWQQIRSDYDRSTLDWPRLLAYAKRIAAQMSVAEPSVDSWSLMRRYWRHSEKTPSYAETLREEIDYLLLRDGSLVVEVTSWSEMMNPRYWETEKSATRRPFNADSVAMFDFERRVYVSRDRSVDTNRDRSEELLVHAKGVGLSKRLKELSSRQPDSGLVVPPSAL